MDPETAQQSANLMSPYMQYGFAGFCAILLGIFVWILKSILGERKDMSIERKDMFVASAALQSRTIDVVAANTKVMQELIASGQQLLNVQQETLQGVKENQKLLIAHVAKTEGK